MSLAKRIALGPFSMLLLMVMVGAAGYFGLTRIGGKMESYNAISHFQYTVASISKATDQYLLAMANGEKALSVKLHKDAVETIDEGVGAAKALEDSGFLTDSANGSDLASAEKDLDAYQANLAEYARLESEKAGLAAKTEALFPRISEDTKKGLLLNQDMMLSGKKLAISAAGYVGQTTKRNWDDVLSSFEQMKKSVDAWYAQVENSKELSQVGADIRKDVAALHKLLEDDHGLATKQAQLLGSMNASTTALFNLCSNLMTTGTEGLHTQMRMSLRLIYGFVLAALLIGIAYMVISVKKIMSLTNSVISGVSSSADRIAATSGQMTSSAQSLAEGSSQQAASIEETSASLEEMAAMTQQNAENAKQADSLMRSANVVVSDANEAMERLTASMSEISTASERHRKSSRPSMKSPSRPTCWH